MKNFHQAMIFIFVLIFLLPGGCQKQEQNKYYPEYPNIILFLIDELGWTDTSVPFMKDLTPNNLYQNTPEIEKMAF